MHERRICIHGHFYQPPRENAWLEAIERQDSALPYHDWNERVADECYGPNAHARILSEKGLIERIVNNYASISFNFGPTLLEWLQRKDQDVYRAILEADRLGQARFGGHGSAMAQAYNHAILPLCNARDRRTQVRWGVADFEHRFGRTPEGMWLPETAVCVPTLEELAAAGIKFTILEPRQAARVRRIGEKTWHDLAEGDLDPTMAYRCALPSGAAIALFFYDGPISRAIAFEGLLNKGENLYGRLRGAFDDRRDHAQLVHIATDGESYGHHHRHGEMALAYAIKLIEDDPSVKLANYGQFLELHPPTHEIQIRERTAWSCAHGLGRWERDCGCNSGAHPGWNQKWRAPLRKGLDDLRDALAPVFEGAVAGLLRDPWVARDAYIDVMLERSPTRLERFLAQQATRRLDPAERTRVLEGLEMQRHLQLMQASCGWFFDDIGGIETVQLLQYAARAVQLGQRLAQRDLAHRLAGRDFEQPLLATLEQAKSNDPAVGDGRRIWERQIAPARVDLAKVAAHHGVGMLFREYPKVANVYCYTVERLAAETREAGEARLVVGHVRVTSNIVQDSGEFGFAVLYFGGHNLTGGAHPWPGEAQHQAMRDGLIAAFERADLPEVIRCLDQSFEAATYSLRSLFKDDQHWVLERMLASTTSEIEEAYRQIHDRHVPLMRFMKDLGLPTPPAIQAAAEFALGSMLRAELEREEPDLARVGELLDQATEERVRLDAAGLEYPVRRSLEHLMGRFSHDPSNLGLLRRCLEMVALLDRFPFKVDLAQAQNFCYRVMENQHAQQWRRAKTDSTARQWVEAFQALGKALWVRVQAAETPAAKAKRQADGAMLARKAGQEDSRDSS
jgi:alpha-amylase/alpha-mannosidase (GH57 family)